MKFSVLLSLYYKEKPEYLQQSIDSILSQTLLPDEIVIVKDGPLTEELDAILEEYRQKCPYLKFVTLKENVGLGIALNEGLKHCSNELIARMDTDDICMPERFAKQVAIFIAHPEYDLVSAWVDEFAGTIDNVKTTRYLPELPDQIFEYGKRRCPVNHPVTMFKKSSVEKVGGYMHCLNLEDYYLWARMLVNGAKFYNIQESLLWFRISDEVFKRRGGFRYAKTEAAFMWELYKIGYIGAVIAILYGVLRFFVRVVPSSWRAYLYRNLLRKSCKID